MLRLFHQNTIAQSIVILLTVALLCVRALMLSLAPVSSQHFSPIYDLIYDHLYLMPKLAIAITMVMILLEGIWLNIILINNKITRPHSLMPTLLYTLAMLWGPDAGTMTPMLIVNALIIGALGQMLSNGSTTLDVSHNFNSAFLVSLASLCYMPSAYYLLPFIISFSLYKQYRWRDMAVAFLGLIAPYLLFLTVVFLTDRLEYNLILMRHDLSDIDIAFNQTSTLSIVCSVIFVISLLWALMHEFSTNGEKNIQQRINTGILTLPLIACCAIVCFGTLIPFDTQPWAITFAFLVSRLLLAKRRRLWIGELALWIIILCAVL